MDKRFLLALVLTALVVVATPILFPSPTPARRTPVSAMSDSSRPASSIVPAPSVAPRDSARVLAPPPSQVAANPPTDSLSAPVAVAPVETTIADSLTQYRLSNIGATPVSVVMRKHRALNGATGQVDLVRPGEPLLRYRLVVP